jgi:hypothetical protein
MFASTGVKRRLRSQWKRFLSEMLQASAWAGLNPRRGQCRRIAPENISIVAVCCHIMRQRISPSEKDGFSTAGDGPVGMGTFRR